MSGPPPSLDRRRLLALGAAGLGVNGGVSIAGRPAELYTLTPKSTFDEAVPSVEWQLLVEQPLASSALDTARIAFLSSPIRVDYYADVAWTARAPALVQTLMVESFENARRIVSIGREGFGLRADFILKTELREFQAELTDPGGRAAQARVRLNAKLVRVPERVIVAGETFEATAPVSGARFEAVVLAFDAALGSVLGALVEWTLITGQRTWLAPR